MPTQLSMGQKVYILFAGAANWAVWFLVTPAAAADYEEVMEEAVPLPQHADGSQRPLPGDVRPSSAFSLISGGKKFFHFTLRKSLVFIVVLFFLSSALTDYCSTRPCLWCPADACSAIIDET